MSTTTHPLIARMDDRADQHRDNAAEQRRTAELYPDYAAGYIRGALIDDCWARAIDRERDDATAAVRELVDHLHACAECADSDETNAAYLDAVDAVRRIVGTVPS